MIRVELPGEPPLVLEHLLLDLNGTLSWRGELIDGVADRLAKLQPQLLIHVLTADTFGTAEAIATQLGVGVQRVATGVEKADVARKLGPSGVVAIGNGRNDVAMLGVASLGIAIVGPEGAAADAIRVADVVCHSVIDGLDLLVDSRLLVATMRR